MSDKRKKIINFQRDRLLEITKKAGFSRDVKKVIKGPKNPAIEVSPSTSTIIWMRAGAELSPFETFESKEEIESTFVLELEVRLKPALTSDFSDEVEDFIRDIKRKLHDKPTMVDDALNPLAQWSAVSGVGKPEFIPDLGVVDVDINVTIEYVYNPTDP